MAIKSSISQQIWDMKYRFKAIDGTPVDKTMPDTFKRIAVALADPEKDQDHWREVFFEAMSDFKFLPAGRIIAGAGTKRDVTLFNCFVMGEIPDDMSGIFTSLKEAALTMQQGGGIGYDFSSLRPKGAPVRGVSADASGPLSFMDVWDAMCRTIMSAGSRRGAMMAVMRCDHPDIEDFIDAKQAPGRLRMFNLSVLITDDFMEAVREDVSWNLSFDGFFLWQDPETAYIMKKELNRIPFWKWYMAKSQHVVINRSGAASTMRQMVSDSEHILAEGRSIVIFPEGTRSEPGKTNIYHPGIAALYRRVGATVIPVALNTGLFWGRRQFLKHPGKMIIQFLPAMPIDLDRKQFMSQLESAIEDTTRDLEQEALRSHPHLHLNTVEN